MSAFPDLPVLQVPSFACDVVLAAPHPDPANGGPCATCAFRPGTEAHRSDYTTAIARLCVEGGVPFDCHEQQRLCRGFIAAMNVRGPTETDDEKQWQQVCADGAEILGKCIAAAVAEDQS